MTEAPTSNASREAPSLAPLAVNTQASADSPGQTPEPEFSEPQPAELSGQPASSAVLQALEGDDEIKEIKSTMLDSAGLASQAASQALKAGADLEQATQKLSSLYAKQRKLGLMVLVSCATLMVIGMVLFVFMSSGLQQRIAQADAMLLAVGKRIVSMNESLELLKGSGEILRDISSNQSALSSQQTKLDGRLDDLLRTAQSAVISPTKDTKTQDISKLLQGMELQIQGNVSAIKDLSAQLRSKPAASADAVMIRREVEASLLRRQSKPTTPIATATPTPTPAPTPAPTATPVPPVANAAPVKPVERLVQYPRVQSTPTVTP
jgi:hypothetical protein